MSKLAPLATLLQAKSHFGTTNREKAAKAAKMARARRPSNMLFSPCFFEGGQDGQAATWILLATLVVIACQRFDAALAPSLTIQVALAIHTASNCGLP